nr:HAMP domain-containing protein [Anaerolineae bacterium]
MTVKRRFPHILRGLKAQLLLWAVLPLTLALIGVAFTGVYSHERTMQALVQERDRTLAMLYAGRIEDALAQRAHALHTLAHQDAPPDATNPILALFDGGIAWLGDEGWTFVPTGDGWAARLEWLDLDSPGESEVRYQLLDEELLIVVGRADGAAVGASSITGLGLPALLTGAYDPGRRGVIYVVDGSGRVLYHPEPTVCGADYSAHSGIREALSGTAGSTLCRDPAGERLVLSYAVVEPVGWRVIIAISRDELTDPILRLPRLAPLVALVAVLVTALALYFGVRYVGRPLQTLARQADRVTWGDFSAIEEPVAGVEEIEELQRALQDMAVRIQGYQTGMRDYIAAIIQGQETERARLARELHDETAQALIALSQRLQMAQRALARDDIERLQALLAQLRTMSTQTLEEVRRFSRDLRPVYLEDLGFLPALEILVRDLQREGTLEARFEVQGRSRLLAPDLELTAYRIAQEALNNAARHAQARHVTLRVAFAADMLTLTVTDDGVGFRVPEQPGDLTRQGHFGLMGMRERTLLIGGELQIISSPGRGTTVVARFPLDEQRDP